MPFLTALRHTGTQKGALPRWTSISYVATHLKWELQQRVILSARYLLRTNKHITEQQQSCETATYCAVNFHTLLKFFAVLAWTLSSSLPRLPCGGNCGNGCHLTSPRARHISVTGCKKIEGRKFRILWDVTPCRLRKQSRRASKTALLVTAVRPSSPEQSQRIWGTTKGITLVRRFVKMCFRLSS